MPTLKEAIERGHYQLVAYRLVLACARALRNGNSHHGSKKATKLLLQRPR